ncbi:hypothetical protein, partial [Parasutterella sp.]|uniref:hypothetical protein n=1 Tax=Parasutterella sp. TaxID=2049037 RepID=UPI003AF14F9F
CRVLQRRQSVFRNRADICSLQPFSTSIRQTPSSKETSSCPNVSLITLLITDGIIHNVNKARERKTSLLTMIIGG